jgi:DNA-binding MarR family transcriptional regulator
MHSSKDPSVRAALDSLRRVVRGLRVSAGEVEKRSGISLAQLFVLGMLADGRPRSIIELAAETLTDPSSVSVVVRRLVDAGLVSRSPARDDARRAQLRLTAAGKRLLARAPETPQARLLHALGELPARQLHHMTTALGHLARALGTDDAALFFEDEGKDAAHGRS